MRQTEPGTGSRTLDVQIPHTLEFPQTRVERELVFQIGDFGHERFNAMIHLPIRREKFTAAGVCL